MTWRLPEVLDRLPDHAAELADDAREALRAELDALAPLAALLGHEFTRPALLRAAVTLGSWCNEHVQSGWPSNACLEFFGDAVLDLLTADALWRRFPALAEGTLTRLRASLVSEHALAEVARDISLGDWLYLGRGDDLRGLRSQRGVLADALEAVIGAVYLDARAAGADPMPASERVFDRLFGARVRALSPEDGLDVKSRLQQRIQARYRRTPSYEIVGPRPPAGDPRWRARVVLAHADGRVEELGHGHGRSLRQAERAAAANALATAGPWRDGEGSLDPDATDGDAAIDAEASASSRRRGDERERTGSPGLEAPARELPSVIADATAAAHAMARREDGDPEAPAVSRRRERDAARGPTSPEEASRPRAGAEAHATAEGHERDRAGGVHADSRSRHGGGPEAHETARRREPEGAIPEDQETSRDGDGSIADPGGSSSQRYARDGAGGRASAEAHDASREGGRACSAAHGRSQEGRAETTPEMHAASRTRRPPPFDD